MLLYSILLLYSWKSVFKTPTYPLALRALTEVPKGSCLLLRLLMMFRHFIYFIIRRDWNTDTASFGSAANSAKDNNFWGEVWRREREGVGPRLGKWTIEVRGTGGRNVRCRRCLRCRIMGSLGFRPPSRTQQLSRS